jgi:sugar/nucleoside kinase (ribokinase family)
MSLDLVCAGNLLVDDLVLADGHTVMGEAGGAVLYAALAARLWLDRVGIVSVVGSDYPARMLEALERRDIDLAGVRRLGRPGLRIWLLYEEGGRQLVHRLGSPSHAEVSPAPEAIPASYADARAFHLSPMPLESQRALVAALAGKKAFISVDPREPVREENLAVWRGVLENVDAFFPGHDELQLSGAVGDPRRAIRRLAGGRLRFVALKHGARGGVVYDLQRDQAEEWEPSPGPVADPTGAGDSFAAGFVSGWLVTGSVAAAIQRGVVAASVAVEAEGARGFLGVTRAEAERRRQQWFGAEKRR